MKLNNRKCIATHKSLPKSELIRIVKLKDGSFEVNSKTKGRGAYIQKDINLLQDIKRKKLLNRAFKIDVPSDVYNKLEKELKEETCQIKEN